VKAGTRATGPAELALEGESRLGRALSRAARWHGYELTHGHELTNGSDVTHGHEVTDSHELPYGTSRSEPLPGPRLTRRRDGTTLASVALEPDDTLGAAIAEDALRRVMRSWPGTGPSCAVVLAPAGGVTGPADAGPVDAVAVGGHRVLESSGAHCAIRLLRAQHTRCWLVSYSCEPVRDEWPGPQGPDVERVPSWVALDTARLVEYAHDRGLGDDWPGLLQLGDVQRGPGRRAEALFAFTEAGYARRLVGSLLAKTRVA
jgi:hypothetical protein